MTRGRFRSIERVYFDMDGTLVNSRKTAISAAKKGLKAYYNETGTDPEEVSPDDIESLIGLPPEAYFRQLLSESNDQAVKRVRELVGRQEVQEVKNGNIRFYKDFPEILDRLRKDGRRLILVTNGGRGYFSAINETLNLNRHFDELYCSDDSPTGEKPDLVEELQDRLPSRSSVLIGDRHYDLEAAHENNMSFIGCLWGFGTQDELEEAETLISEPDDLRTLFDLAPR